MSSMSAYEYATKVEPGFDIGGSLSWLHKLAWGNDPERFFSSMQVKRDDVQLNTSVPATITKLGWMGDPIRQNVFASGHTPTPRLLAMCGVSSIFVRDDYLALLREIMVTSVYGPTQEGTNTNAMAVHSTISNPFKDCMDGPLRQAGATVIGNPGIGKSTFLIYVLVLRLIASQTTIFQWKANEFFVVTSEGVFRVSPPNTAGLEYHVPNTTWFLVDSNASITDVPLEFAELYRMHGGFILQAASPRESRIQWQKKVGNTTMYWMAPWTLAELIAGRQLQLRLSARNITEMQMASFCETYGTSANITYDCAAYDTLAPDSGFGLKVRSQLSKLSNDVIHRLLRMPLDIVMEESISHLLTTIQPNPENHKSYSLDISTPHMVDLVLERLNILDQDAALRLYWLFLTTPFTRAGAGYLLEKAFLEQFQRGGCWSVKKMKRTQAKVNTHWTTDQHAPVSYLQLGYKDGVVEMSCAAPDPQSMIELPCWTLPSTGQVVLHSGFFIPEAKNQASYDSFVFDDQKKYAVLFQVTVSPTHDIKNSGLLRLPRDKVASIDLVVVTCPEKFKGTREIVMLSEPSQRIWNVYLLELGC